MTGSSRIRGFYRLSTQDRRRVVAAFAALAPDHPGLAALESGVDPALLDAFAENVIGAFPLPLGVAANFLVDGRDVLVPMAVEESSVVAAASNMARLARPLGGFTTTVVGELMIGQVQLRFVPDVDRARAAIETAADGLVAEARSLDATLVKHGGGCRALEVRSFAASETDGDGDVLVVHFLVDCRDAMGANAVNSICERLGPRLADISGGTLGLKILSNLADRRRVRAACRVASDALAFDGRDGGEVADAIVAAARFAGYDPYRAATHNKGVMNGIDPVVIATGNDWRAVEAGAHAWAASSGRYTALSRWWREPDGTLHGALELPMQVGTVGGVTRLHPLARLSLELLRVRSGDELARVICAVGLAQNLGALRALSTEGIQKGHMRLHQRNLELAKADP